MIISLNWLREWVDVDATAQDIADKLSVSGLEVEHVAAWSSVKGGMKGFVIGQVMECAKHPNADKLSVTKVDIGLGELQPIVCGAPNVADGQKVVVATVGTEVTVPGKGAFTIGEAKIRGEISRGMICAEDEMGLGSSHDGILVLPDNAPVGKQASAYFEVANDEILEIGLTANRGDAASHLGVARDVAALFDTQVNMPEITIRPLANGKLKVGIENAEHCSLYVALLVNDVEVSESANHIKNHLRAIGIEPKNHLIDATNYTLHALGQPVHAFDADKIRGNELNVRLAAKGETFVTLDKIQRECKGGELVIADAEGIVAFAGVMGGIESAVSETTKNVIIESAHFHPGLVRKTARAHGLNTDASFRFERSTDPEICRKAAFYAADLMLANGTGSVTECSQCLVKEFEPKIIELDLAKLGAFAGTIIAPETAVGILQSLGFEIAGSGNIRQVTVPSWRNDVGEVVDLYEEVMRIYGYDNIPMGGKMNVSLPVFKGMDSHKKLGIAAQYLGANGFFEISNNSLTAARFYNEDTLKNMVSINNPLSSDLEWMRGSLLPGMLQAAAYNRNRKTENIRFYEFGRVYTQQDEILETDKLGILYGGNVFEESWEEKNKAMDFYFGKRLIDNLFVQLAIKEPMAYELKSVPQFLKDMFDLNGEFWYAELHWKNALGVSEKQIPKVTEPAKFPFMRRDLSLVMDKSVHFEKIEEVIASQKLALLKKVNVFDVFEGKPLEEGKKSIAIAFYLGKDDETLTDELADNHMNKLIAAFENAGAVIRR